MIGNGVMASREPVSVRAVEVAAMLARRLPGSDPDRLAAQLTGLRIRAQHLTALATHLADHPDALSSGRSDGPACLRRVLEMLALEHPSVRRAQCSTCGSSGRLPYRVNGTGLCATCYRRVHLVTCVRCGGSGSPAAREDEGTVCARCYSADPGRHEPCGVCGQQARVAARVEGQARCQNCRPRQLYTCGSCGRDGQPAHAIVADFGPLCSTCYHRRRTGQCERCGQVTAKLRFNSATGPVICYRCWQPPYATCRSCGELRACERGDRSGAPICVTCRGRARPLRACAFCGRLRRLRSTLALGPICGPCFATVRRAPGRCAHCHQTRPLVGADDQGARVCGPCSGDGRDHACRQCGQIALLHADRRCPTCIVTERVTDLLTGPDGVVPTQLRGLHQLLLTENPARAQIWLDHTKWSRLLEALIAGGQPLTHELLDVIAGQRQSVRHLRQALIHAGALPQRDESLAAVEQWLDTLLTSIPAHHAALINQPPPGQPHPRR